MGTSWLIVYSSSVILLLLVRSTVGLEVEDKIPVVINTWPFIDAGEKAWKILYKENGSSLDAVENGCAVCEILQCSRSVGPGGRPDENGETTLDAMIMDGTTHDVGAVGALRRVKSAISVARMVMERTTHTFLVGDQATDFAVMMGFEEELLTTNSSMEKYEDWLNNSCQPNSWKNVIPDPTTTCGPYIPADVSNSAKRLMVAEEGKNFDIDNHDTIGMIAIDHEGNIAGGTSTNGLRHKVPGRVGDSPIPGSGSYVDRDIGGAAATGNGDIMMRFMPSLVTVEGMRTGLSPRMAAQAALLKIASYYPEFRGAIIALSITGEYGAECHGYDRFSYVVGNPELQNVSVKNITCFISN